MPYIIFLILIIGKFFNRNYIKAIIFSSLLIISPAKSIEILIPKNLNKLNSHLNEIKYKKKGNKHNF